ncbi:MAG: hypothetical protein Q4C47_01285 [Planctomycetia bacterium]|nr:hypothetical protein [Planctomycetia bacterium]
MDVRVYRAATMCEALALVSRELGPDAAILHTREVHCGLLGRLLGRRLIEVTASIEVNVPSRLPERSSFSETPTMTTATASQTREPRMRTTEMTGMTAMIPGTVERTMSRGDSPEVGIPGGVDSGTAPLPSTLSEKPEPESVFHTPDSTLSGMHMLTSGAGFPNDEPADRTETVESYTETAKSLYSSAETETGMEEKAGVSGTGTVKTERHSGNQVSDLHVMLRELAKHTRQSHGNEPSELCFRLFTDLLDAEIPEEFARALVDRIRSELKPGQPLDESLLRARILRLIESGIRCSGPIRVHPGEHRLVALVGPTGVGKTTTIAKLAANYRLREHRSVGLITVDTYRIAAVEQIRTYAEIIDLPMQVVSSPYEIEGAVQRMRDLDLILLDTAGRSPRDSERLAELQDYLTKAGAGEVHLVLSTTASTRSLSQTVEQFSIAGPTHLLLTKLDEATGLGGIWPLIRDGKLPLSYLTNGQNVPDDIEVADSSRVARAMLGLAEPVGQPAGIDVQG